MGGDHAPGVVLKGADIALVRYPGTRFLLFGDESRVAPLLAKLPRLAKATTLQHTEEVVADDAKPSVALRAARRSSMRLAIEAVGAAAAKVRGGMTPLRCHGFVEGDDIAAGTVDVVVTDGFTGNVALKTAEGIAKLFSESLRASFRYSPLARIGYVFARGA